MPIFISYTHSDSEFAQSLAINLVQAKQNVWIDKWELNAGDSLMERVQNALGDADAILILLSEDSVQSEWCKKELNSGLTRELEEKSTLVIPIVLDNCKIPLFLKDKLRIDFRKGRDEQLALLLRSLEKISNPSQGRIDTPEYHVDWSMNSIGHDERQGIEWIFVDHSEKLPYVVMTQVLMLPKGYSAKAYNLLLTDDERFIFSARCMEFALKKVDDFCIILSSSVPQVLERVIDDDVHGGKVSVQITVRRMGMDNGMDTLVQVDNNLREAIKHTLGVTRKNI
uniref:TIR domain-containing protein n=1 Tax=OCS116 cluster bacterium TaxID=2030921 RepID=A0A2A4Z6H4_9PROT